MDASSEHDGAAGEEVQLDAAQLEEGYQRWCRIASWVEGDSAAARGASPASTFVAGERASLRAAGTQSPARLQAQHTRARPRSGVSSSQQTRQEASVELARSPQAKGHGAQQQRKARIASPQLSPSTTTVSRRPHEAAVPRPRRDAPDRSNGARASLSEADCVSPQHNTANGTARLASRASGTLVAEDTRTALAADARRNTAVR